MDVFGYHIPSLAVAAAAFSSVYAAFAKFDADQSDKNREFARQWLLGLKVDDRQWAQFFKELFTKVFGERHLSAKCIGRTALLSVGIFSVAAIYIFALNIAILGRVGGDESSRKLSLVFIGNWLPFAIVVDYLSLWKTRVLLTKELFSSSLFSAMAVVIADVLATIVITVVAAISINALFGNGGLAYGNFWLGTPLILHIERAAKFQLLYFQQGFAVSKLEFLPPLLTSAWLWVYLIVAHAMRTVNRVPALLRLLSKVQDFEAHPVRTIGYVAATVSAIFIGIITLT